MAIEPVLYAQGDDALENLWNVIIPPTFPGCLDTVGINLRVTKIALPSWINTSYKVDYKNEYAEKPSGKQGTDKKITITFRVDRNWKVYCSLLNWFNFINNHENGMGSPDILNGVSLIRIPIIVLNMDQAGVSTTTGWVFKGSYIEDISATNLTYDAGNPISVDASFKFISPINLRPL